MDGFPYNKRVVIGATSSGKSTLAEQLANKLGSDFIELDALNWGPNWTAAGDELLRSRAEIIIWLDYSLQVIFWRLLTRTIRRAVTQEELWNGNREKFWWH